MARPIVFAVGRDPLKGMGGHSSYVRAHARAAIRAGFEPHVFCAASDTAIIESDIGVIHRVRSSPFQFFPKNVEAGNRKSLIIWHAPLIASAMEAFLLERKSPHLIHGFGTWLSLIHI